MREGRPSNAAGGVRFLPLASVAAFAAFLALGRAVSHSPPGPLDLSAASESGHFVALALLLRSAGLFTPYCVLCVLALCAGLVRRVWLPAALVAIVQLVIVWRASDNFKLLFRRERPPWWFHIQENTYAYASGHAALSLAFYGFAAYAVWVSSASAAVKRLVAIGCATLVAAFGWSRLALGAHYLTDVLGGYLLGLTTLCLAIPAYELVRAALGRAAMRQTS